MLFLAGGFIFVFSKEYGFTPCISMRGFLYPIAYRPKHLFCFIPYCVYKRISLLFIRD